MTVHHRAGSSQTRIPQRSARAASAGSVVDSENQGELTWIFAGLVRRLILRIAPSWLEVGLRACSFDLGEPSAVPLGSAANGDQVPPDTTNVDLSGAFGVA